jgi:hypothetical protein
LCAFLSVKELNNYETTLARLGKLTKGWKNFLQSQMKSISIIVRYNEKVIEDI